MKRLQNLLAAFVFLVFAGCASNRPAPPENPADVVPRTLTFSIITVVGPSYHVRFENGLVTYSSTQPGEKSKPPLHRAPTDEQWREFRRQLDHLKVWQWKPSYGNKLFVGGTQWSLDIVYPDRSIHTEGHRDFPRHYESFLK